MWPRILALFRGGLARGAGAARGAAGSAVSRVGAGATAVSSGERLSNFANTVYAGQALIGGLLNITNMLTNDFVHVITVEVKGGPKANIKRIWQLAVSAAFGKYKQGVNSVTPLVISATWDVTGKAVSVQLKYESKGIIGNAFSLGEQRFNKCMDFIKNGPSQELIGSTWLLSTHKIGKDRGDDNSPENGVLSGLLDKLKKLIASGNATEQAVAQAGAQAAFQQILGQPAGRLQAEGFGNRISTTFTGGDVDTLPDDGRQILTANKNNPNLQPFRPDTDYLLALVSAALTDPCVLPASPPGPTDGGQVAVKRVVTVHAPGAGNTNMEKINQTTDETIFIPLVIPDINVAAFGGAGAVAAALTSTKGNDGYQAPKTNIPNVRGAKNDPR